jgi:hypothetical protein
VSPDTGLGADASHDHPASQQSAGRWDAGGLGEEEEEEAPIARSAIGLPRPAAPAGARSRRSSGGEASHAHGPLPAPPSPAAYRDLWASPAAHPTAGGPHASFEGHGHSSHARTGTGGLHPLSGDVPGALFRRQPAPNHETQHSIVGARQTDGTDHTGTAATDADARRVFESGVDASFRSDASGHAGFSDPDAVTAELEALQEQMNAMRARLARQGEAGRRGPATAQIAAGGPSNRGEF